MRNSGNVAHRFRTRFIVFKPAFFASCMTAWPTYHDDDGTLSELWSQNIVALHRNVTHRAIGAVLDDPLARAESNELRQ
jgi:hypothetical protein